MGHEVSRWVWCQKTEKTTLSRYFESTMYIYIYIYGHPLPQKKIKNPLNISFFKWYFQYTPGLWMSSILGWKNSPKEGPNSIQNKGSFGSRYIVCTLRMIFRYDIHYSWNIGISLPFVRYSYVSILVTWRSAGSSMMLVGADAKSNPTKSTSWDTFPKKLGRGSRFPGLWLMISQSWAAWMTIFPSQRVAVEGEGKLRNDKFQLLGFLVSIFFRQFRVCIYSRSEFSAWLMLWWAPLRFVRRFFQGIQSDPYPTFPIIVQSDGMEKCHLFEDIPWTIHGGFTYKSPMKRKENDLNQTSHEDMEPSRENLQGCMIFLVVWLNSWKIGVVFQVGSVVWDSNQATQKVINN